MTPPSAHRSRLLALTLLIASLTLACSRAPRNHWWQFWRRGAPADVAHIDEQAIPGPQGYEDAFASGRISPDDLALNPDEDSIGLPEPEPIRQDTEGILADLQTIYFDYDSFSLTAEAQQALRENARWISAHPGLQIRVEGHCDERGTEEYNYNLGQKRAQAVREFLIQRGIEDTRLHTWSWGETRPVAPGHTEEAWRLNRRVQFAVWTTE